MKFWDSSAIVPVLVPEPQTNACQSFLKQDAEMLVWTLTPTEVLSAIYRKVRGGTLEESQVLNIRENLFRLGQGWSEIIQLETVKQKAHRLLAVHSLRAADALQLAAALVAFEDRTEGEGFITFDDNLAIAARKEGFQVIS